jgi:transcriptional regulator with XRE-family HTH domain
VDPTAQFAQNLRRLRDAAGFTQEALSEATKIDPGEISRLERGIRDPQLRTIVRIARGLDVPVTDLLSGIE